MGKLEDYNKTVWGDRQVEEWKTRLEAPPEERPAPTEEQLAKAQEILKGRKSHSRR